MSASIIVANGPGPMPANSTTRTPLRGPTGQAVSSTVSPANNSTAPSAWVRVISGHALVDVERAALRLRRHPHGDDVAPLQLERLAFDEIADAAAEPTLGHDEPFVAEHAESLPDRFSSDAERLAELSFGRQVVTRLETPACDVGPNRVGDLEVDGSVATRINGHAHHCRYPRTHRFIWLYVVRALCP